MHVTSTSPRKMSGSKPVAYWDRTDKMIRNWDTNQALPDYEGPCMVYLDLSGPVVVYTFLRAGLRHWQDSKGIVTDVLQIGITITN